METPVVGCLADSREAAVVADWIWEEWARHEPGVSREASDAGVYGALDAAPVPHFVIARVDDVPIGCASIVAADLPTRQDLGPWLANVYVVPAWRGRGLGTALVDRAMRHGTAVADRLYLYTFGTTALYERLGWRPHDTGDYAGRPISVLRYDVVGPRPA